MYRRLQRGLDAVDVTAETKLATLHLAPVFLQFGGFFLLASQQRGVLLLACAALLDAAEGQEAH